MNILYEDTALVVLDKPAGLTSEEGVPAALRQRWGRPDAYVGVIHRLDTGVSGLMVYARTPGAAAALTKQVTESQQAYAILDGRAEAGPGAPAQPCFLKTYRAVIAGGPDEQLPPEGILRDYLFKDSRKGRVFPVKRPRKGGAGSRAGILHRRDSPGRFPEPCGDHAPHRADTSDPGAVCLPEAPALRRRQIWQPVQREHCPAERRAAVRPPGDRQAHGLFSAPARRRTVEGVFGIRLLHMVNILALSVTCGDTSPKGRGLGKKMKFAWTAKGSHFGGAGIA